MSTATIRDTTIHYEIDGAGPPLLFIHGMCGDARVWADQVRRLADRFTCVTYDRRGHTRSGLGDEPESVTTHVEDAIALIEHLGLDRPIVVGSSGGARIAFELIRTRPDVVSGAVLSEPPILSLDPEGGPAFMDQVGTVVGPAARSGGPSAAVDAFFTLVCGGLWSTLDEEHRDRYRANGPMMLAEFEGEPYRASVEDVAGVEVPCLVMTGLDSPPAFQTIARTIARALPDARLVELEHSGHVTYAEQPEMFADAVAAFGTELFSAQSAS